MEALEAVAAVHLELSCPLCHKMMQEPQTFNTPMCGHTFCRDCVIATLEGPGIVKSQCPTCKQPAWKKDLHTNHKYTAIAEATAHLAAILRSQGLDFQLLDGLEQPVGDASDAVASDIDVDDAEAAGTPADQTGNAVAAQPLGTTVSPANEPCEDLEAILPQCALELGTNADVHPPDQAAACVAEQQPVLSAAEVQEEVIPDSGSGPAAAVGIAAMVAGPAVQQQQHCHPAQPSFDGSGWIPAAATAVPGGKVSILADLVGMPVTCSSEPQQQVAQQQLQEPPEHSPRHQQSVDAATQQQPLSQQQPLQQQQQWYGQQAPSHLLQHSLGMNDEQLPGCSYWHYQRLLEGMVDNLQANVQQQQQQQQQDLPPCFSSILEQVLQPTGSELHFAQQDLQDIDAMLDDIDAALEGVPECHRLQQKQQPQCLRSQQQKQQQALHSCCTTCTSQDPTEAPSITELHHQQQQQPAAAAAAPPGRPLSLRKRRRGRASGRSRAAGGFSGGFLGKGLVGTAGYSGVRLAACSGAGISFSNCSGPLVGHTGRPSLEGAIDAAMAAARAADSVVTQVQEVPSLQQQQLEVEEHKKHLQQAASAVEQQQQQHQHQLGQQSAQQTASASVSGSAVQARSNKGRMGRAAAAADESGSLTSGTAGRRSSRRTAAAVTKALNVANEVQPGSTIIGVRLKVYWPADKCYYTGQVTDYNPRNKRHTVAYEDGDVEQLDLTKEDYIPLFSEDEQEQQQQQQQQQLKSERQTEQRVCDQDQQQQAPDQGLHPEAAVAAGRQARQQQQQEQNVPKAEQQQTSSKLHHQEEEPSVSAQNRTAATDPGNQAAVDVGHPQPQLPKQPHVPQQPQQQNLWNLRQQLLQAKGLATSRQSRKQHHQQQQQQQQQSLKLQQQEASTSSLQGRIVQQQQPLRQQHKHAVKSRVGAAGRKRKRRQHDCDSDNLSSSSSSLCGSDVTSGGDSAYEADGEPQDSDDSDEYAAGTASRAKRGAVLLESECVSDLEVAAAAADSEGSDSFVKQQLKSRRAKATRKQAVANRAKQRQRRHQAEAAAWHSKRQQQQQGNGRPSAAPSRQQQLEPVLVSDSDADVVDDQIAATTTGPNQHQKAAVSLQQRQQRRRELLLQQEAEAAWAVMEQQLSDEVSSDSPEHSESEQEAESADADLDADLTPDLQHSTEAPAEQAEAQVSVDDAGQPAAELFRPLATAVQQDIGSQLQEAAAISTGEPAEQHSQQEGTSPMQQQHLDRVDQNAVAVTNATSTIRSGNTAQQLAADGKYCDLLSDSMGTSYSSSQHLVSSEEHDENAAAADIAGPQPQQQAVGAGACGVVHAPQTSSRPVGKRRRTAKQPLDCVPAGRQQLSAGAPDGAVGDQSRCMDMQPAAELHPLPSASAPAAAAKTADGRTAGTKRLVTVIGGMDKDTVSRYQPVLQAMGADFAKEVSGKYSHCVVTPVDEHGYFRTTNKAVLKALVLGVPVVKHMWLQDSVDQQCLLPVQDYLPKGQNKVPEGGPARSLAAKDHNRRLFEGLVVVAAAVNQKQVEVQQMLAMLAVIGRACTLLHGPGLQYIEAEPDKRPIAAAAAVELCKDRRVLVLLSDSKDHASARALQQWWPTAEVVTANYLTDCICAYRILDPQPYFMEK